MKLPEYLAYEYGFPVTGKAKAKFATRVGVSKHAVFKWFTGDRLPRRNYMLKIKKITKDQVDFKDWYS